MEESDLTRGLAGLKVMVADDSPAVRRHAGRLLEQAGCRVTRVADGYAALAAIVDHRPDLILADVEMPRLDGYQLCTLVKNHPGYLDTPVILLTRGHSLDRRARARGVRSDAWLDKPLAPERLFATLRTQLAPSRNP